MAEPTAPEVDLPAVEAAVQDALRRGDDSELALLGYGEISLVVGWPTGSPVAACKRLPPFASRTAAESYGRRFAEYLDVLVDRGVEPVASRFSVIETHVPTAPDAVVAYVVQPVLDAGSLGPNVFRRDTPDPEHPLVSGIVDAITSVCDERTGLDAQLSNWALVDGGMRYLDVSTPMLFDAAGKVELDLGVFLASFPWALRGVIGRFVAPGVVGAFRDPRRMCVDVAANLHKERLAHWIPAVLQAANAEVSPPVTEDEARRYYRSDARLWEVMLRLRRVDRWWQRRVRHRIYPFLLPGHIER